jgi:hypothetical protein
VQIDKSGAGTTGETSFSERPQTRPATECSYTTSTRNCNQKNLQSSPPIDSGQGPNAAHLDRRMPWIADAKAARSARAVAANPLPSVENLTYLAAPRYFIDPAATAERPARSAAVGPGTLQQIVLGYFHDSANDPVPPLDYVAKFTQPARVPSSNAPPSGTGSPVIAVPCNVAVVVDATTGAELLSLAGV